LPVSCRIWNWEWLCMNIKMDNTMKNPRPKVCYCFQLSLRHIRWLFRPDEGYTSNNSGSLRWCHGDNSHVSLWMWAVLS
jgi:hypothetical protein